jgi:ribose 5-phosphate isomerase A
MKELVAKELAKRVKDGDVIGVGTGSTVDLALSEIGLRVKQEKLNLHVVPTSLQSSWKCQQLGLNVMYPGYRGNLSWGFDGADEVDDRFWLIKGKGGALLQEKILAARCDYFVVIVDESKMVKKLGANCAIPVEVIPEAIHVVEQRLRDLNPVSIELRNCTGGKHGPIITEAGNIILDVKFDGIEKELEGRLKSILGVVETGLFIGYTSELLMATTSAVKSIKPPTR